MPSNNKDSEQKLQEAIQRLNIESFISSRLNLAIGKQTSKKIYVDCPFCGDEKAGKQKLGVTPSGEMKGLWKCYRNTCGESGNLVTLYSKVMGDGGKDGNKEGFRVILQEVGLWEEWSKSDPVKQKNNSQKEDRLSAQKEDRLSAQKEDRLLESQPPTASTPPPSPTPPTAPPPTPNTPPTTATPSRTTEIYTRFIALSTLSPAHRSQLKQKRGFTDETIDSLCFRSGGQAVEAVIETLRSEFSDTEIEAAGLLVKVNGNLVYNNQLTEERTVKKSDKGDKGSKGSKKAEKSGHIIIPYLSKNKETGNIEVYHIRPHKLGLEGKPPEIYCSFLLLALCNHGEGSSSEVILTEGEFKAAALYQLGIPAIAIPGVSAFGAKYFERLTEFLRAHNVKNLTVIFDNEIKDNSSYSNYKQKPEDRYDTEYWSYLMAYKLNRDGGFSSRVGRLPDEWRVAEGPDAGKIDFDMALAMGKTAEDMLSCASHAVTLTPKEYLDSLPEEATKIVRRKLSRHFARIPVKREFNKYIGLRQKGGESYEETLSNFIINIKSSFYTADGVIRNVQMVNEIGEKSEIFSLTPGDMAGLNEFKKFAFGKGNYIFKGTTNDLLYIWELEFMRDTGDLVFMPDRIGYIGDGLWLFGSMAIKEGKSYKPDNDGIFWIDSKGYKPVSVQINSRGESVEETIPTLCGEEIDLVEMAQRLRETVGGYEAYMGIGWVIASIFGQDVFEKYRCMPILFPHGKRESGKTTFMWWLMGMFGIEVEAPGISESTQNFIARSLSYYSSIGCWFDEYRNEKKVTQKDGFFRSAYDRHVAGKGTTTAFQTRGFTVRASVAISGEEIPKDNGLFTRTIPLQISSYRRSRTWYEWLNRNHQKFSYLTYYLLMNYDRLRPGVMAAMAELKEALLKHELSDRTAQNWAICAGAFSAVIEKDPEFIKWVLEACKDIKQTGESEHMLNQFLTDLSILISEEEIDGKYIKYDIGNKELVIWLSGAYGKWSKYYRNKTGREPFDEQSIKKYVQEEPYFVHGRDRDRLDGVQRRVITLDVSCSEAPESLCEIAESIGASYGSGNNGGGHGSHGGPGGPGSSNGSAAGGAYYND